MDEVVLTRRVWSDGITVEVYAGIRSTIVEIRQGASAIRFPSDLIEGVLSNA